MMARQLSLAMLLGISSCVMVAGSSDFDWETISPSSTLKYHPCYEEYQCARLAVPLDWQDESNEHTVALAIIKLPATVPDDDPSFAGTLFTNPGGPGGSGVEIILRRGHQLRDLVSGARQYEVLSWDPRGVGRTSPKADCYDNYLARGTAMMQARDMGFLDAGASVLRQQHARVEGFGRLCEQGAVNGSILPFLSTASVVRDMVEMLDKIEELRNAEKAAMHVSPGETQHPMQIRSHGVARIQYMGFSYGSILGNAFASMYPGRVGRVIVDGIADANDYMKGGWLKNLQDTEKSVQYFYESCFRAADKCALVKSTDTSWRDIQERVDTLVAQVDAKPISVLHDKKTTVISGNDILGIFIGPLYMPIPTYDGAAKALDAALRGNFTLVAESLAGAIPKLDDACGLPNSTTPSLGGDGQTAIICGDAEDATNIEIPYLESLVNELKVQSRTLGAYWAMIFFSCSGWYIRPKWRFTGPFTTPEHDPKIVEGKPAAPLLFLSTRLDPVTPVANAFAMAENHPGSAVLVQDSAGHCTISSPSECTKKVIQDYLYHGIMPENRKVCEADCHPWEACAESASQLGHLDPPYWRRHPLGI